MSSSQAPKSEVLRGLKFLLLAGLIAWGGWGAWQIHQARRAGAALGDALRREPPSSSNTAVPARDELAAAAAHLRLGQFAEAASALAPTATLSAAQQDAAKRFLGKQTALRQRLIAAAAAAEKRQREGGDAAAARAALARVLAAAARGEATAVTSQLEDAEAALDQPASSGPAAVWPADAGGVAARAAGLASAVRTSRALMTEGSAAAGRLIGRAAWHGKAGQFADAAMLLDLAAGLLGVTPAANQTHQIPQWFLDLAQAPSPTSDAARTRAAVELAEAIAQAESPGPAVTALVDKARREFDAGRVAEAAWWASVALEALAIDPAAAAAEAAVVEGSEP